jgi:hypothetical protein
MAEIIEYIIVPAPDAAVAGPKGNPGPPGAPGQNFSIDASGTLEGRNAYDSQGVLFAYLDSENANLYIRETETPGVWSPPIPFGGVQGDVGSGSGISLQLAASFTGAPVVLPAHEGNKRFTLLVTANVSQVIQPGITEQFILPNGTITPPGHKLTLQLGPNDVTGALIDIIDVPGTNKRLVFMLRGTWAVGV